MTKHARHTSAEDQLYKILAEKGFVLLDEDQKAASAAWGVLTSMATTLGVDDNRPQRTRRDD